jgi:hypothetical protein
MTVGETNHSRAGVFTSKPFAPGSPYIHGEKRRWKRQQLISPKQATRTEYDVIPEIGVMVGLYIVTRMVEMMAGKNRWGVVASRTFGAVTVIVAAFVMVDLISSGVTVAQTLQGMPAFPKF